MRGYMYILECADGSYYTGSTKNLKLRLLQHQNGEGANHTKNRLPVKLVYYEEFQRIDHAFYREKQVQGWCREKKEALIFGRYSDLHKLAECKNESHYLNGGFGCAQPPFEDSAQPPFEGSAQPPFEDSAQPPFEDSTKPPFEDSAQPPFEGSAQPPFEDSVQPPFKDSAQPPFKDSTKPPFKDSVQPPFKDSAQPPFKDSAQPPFEDSAQPPFEGSAQPPFED